MPLPQRRFAHPHPHPRANSTPTATAALCPTPRSTANGMLFAFCTDQVAWRPASSVGGLSWKPCVKCSSVRTALHAVRFCPAGPHPAQSKPHRRLFDIVLAELGSPGGQLRAWVARRGRRAPDAACARPYTSCTAATTCAWRMCTLLPCPSPAPAPRAWYGGCDSCGTARTAGCTAAAAPSCALRPMRRAAHRRQGRRQGGPCLPACRRCPARVQSTSGCLGRGTWRTWQGEREQNKAPAPCLGVPWELLTCGMSPQRMRDVL